MKFKFLPFSSFVLLLFLLSVANAQTSDSIIFAPDRPGIATPPDILTFEKLQIESGLQTEHYFDGSALDESYLFPAFLLRIGLLKNAEARVYSDYKYKIVTDSGVSSPKYGMDPITIGTKIKIFNQRILIPNLSVLINLTLPWYGKYEFVPQYLAPSIYLLMSNTISKKFSICYNYGLIWDGNKSPLTQFYTIHLGLCVFKNLSLFAEGFGYTGKYDRARLYYDGGLAFLINNHLQIDVSAAGKYNSTNDYYFVNAGIAWQIAGKKMKF